MSAISATFDIPLQTRQWTLSWARSQQRNIWGKYLNVQIFLVDVLSIFLFISFDPVMDVSKIQKEEGRVWSLVTHSPDLQSQLQNLSSQTTICIPTYQQQKWPENGPKKRPNYLPANANRPKKGPNYLPANASSSWLSDRRCCLARSSRSCLNSGVAVSPHLNLSLARVTSQSWRHILQKIPAR